MNGGQLLNPNFMFFDIRELLYVSSSCFILSNMSLAHSHSLTLTFIMLLLLDFQRCLIWLFSPCCVSFLGFVELNITWRLIVMFCFVLLLSIIVMFSSYRFRLFFLIGERDLVSLIFALLFVSFIVAVLFDC